MELCGLLAALDVECIEEPVLPANVLKWLYEYELDACDKPAMWLLESNVDIEYGMFETLFGVVLVELCVGLNECGLLAALEVECIDEAVLVLDNSDALNGLYAFELYGNELR